MEMKSLFVSRPEMGGHLEQSAQRGSDDTRELDENMIVTAHQQSGMKIHVRLRTCVNIMRKGSTHALAGVVHRGQIARSGSFRSELGRSGFNDAARLHERIGEAR